MIDFENKKGVNNVIWDGSSILYVACHPKKVLDSNGNPIKKDGKFVYEDKTWEEVEYNLSNIIISVFNSLEAKEYIGFLDGKNNFRKVLNPDYKANRKDYIPPKWIEEAKEYLENNWNFHKVDCVESDDMCLIHFRHYKDLSPILVSNDKDLLHTEGICYNWKTDQTFINTEFQERHFFWLQMIMGDVADNMKGIPNLGEKKGQQLLSYIKTDNKFPQVVFDKYIEKLGEDNGIREFIKHYQSLKIVDKIENIPSNLCKNINIFDWEKVPGSF